MCPAINLATELACIYAIAYLGIVGLKFSEAGCPRTSRETDVQSIRPHFHGDGPVNIQGK